MTRLLSALAAGILVVMLAASLPAAAKQPAPITLPEIQVTIGDGNGGKDILRVTPMLQPRKVGEVPAIRARAKAIAASLRKRLKTVTSDQLIPPDGSSEWLEREFWDLAEAVLKPIRLDGAIFRELSIE